MRFKVDEILTALEFLTIVRLRRDGFPTMADVARSVWAFPIAGCVIGVILAGAKIFTGVFLAPTMVALCVVLIWVLLTGGLHLDGWADCWDALAATVSRERRLEILKDSRLGTFGAVSLLLLLAFKTAAVIQADLTALIVAPIAARSIMMMTAYKARHGGRGMAAEIIDNLDYNRVFYAGAIGLTPALLLGIKGTIAVVITIVVARWFKKFAENRLGRVNGDVLGAICELAETVFLVAVC
jgi:adenosylcobinamide-GDP ribazoletransferase